MGGRSLDRRGFLTELTEFTEFFRQDDRIGRRLQDGQKEFWDLKLNA